MKTLLADVKTGTPFNALGNSTSTNVMLTNSLPSMFAAGSTPPLSPRSSSGYPRLKQRTGPSSLGSSLKLASEPVREVIPQVQTTLEINILYQVLGRFFQSKHRRGLT